MKVEKIIDGLRFRLRGLKKSNTVFLEVLDSNDQLIVAKIAIEGKSEEVNKIDLKRPKKDPVQLVAVKPFTPKGLEVAVKRKRGRPRKVVANPTESKAQSNAASKQERLVYRIPVRPDYTLEVSLPVDVSDAELKKIREYLSPVQNLAG